MQPKTLMWVLVFGGSIVGGYIPSFWGAGLFSGAAMIGSLLGALGGLLLGFYIARNF